MVHITPVIPFRLDFRSGVPIHEQVTFAAKKAILSGKIRPGEAFPSVRALSQALKIHANTAQKAIGRLTQEGLLEVRPGIGTIVAQPPASGRAERNRLLSRDAEELIVEAMKLGTDLESLLALIAEQWRKLQRVEEKEKSRG